MKSQLTDREIDVRIDREVFGFEPGQEYIPNPLCTNIQGKPWVHKRCAPLYSTDDAAALQALDKLCKQRKIGYWELSGGKSPTEHRCTVEWLEPGALVSEKKTEYDPCRARAIALAIIAFLDRKQGA